MLPRNRDRETTGRRESRESHKFESQFSGELNDVYLDSDVVLIHNEAASSLSTTQIPCNLSQLPFDQT